MGGRGDRRNGTKALQPHAGPVLRRAQKRLDYVQAADCLVLPYREEALPAHHSGSMAVGRPCVASDVNGIRNSWTMASQGCFFRMTHLRIWPGQLIGWGRTRTCAAPWVIRARQRYHDQFARAQHVRRWRTLLADMAGRPGQSARPRRPP
jgi:hypothetical protein